MKIIFDSEEQKKAFMEIFQQHIICPDGAPGLENRCVMEENCKACWEKAIEMEVKNGQNS